MATDSRSKPSFSPYRKWRIGLQVGLIIFLVLSVVVILAAANTMTMSVFERTREIGTLLAIGMEIGRPLGASPGTGRTSPRSHRS